jgi:hypothetical protein
VLTSAAGVTIVANIDTEFGRGSLADVVGHDEVGYLSAVQFRVSRDAVAGSWVVSHLPGAVNPTCVNGAPIVTEAHPLTGGETLSVGPMRAKLTVSIR